MLTLNRCGIFLFSFCFACTSAKGWQTEELEATNRCQTRVRLAFTNESCSWSGLKVEFIKIGNNYTAYLNLQQGRFPWPACLSTHQISGMLNSPLGEQVLTGYWMQGRQRVVLDPLSSQLLWNNLWNYSEVTIEVAGYQVTLEGGEIFQKEWKQ